MSALITLNIDVTKITKERLYEGKKGKYLQLTVAVNDELDDYGNNASAFEGQSKEERDAKTPKNYLGNGSVVWTDGSVKTKRDLESNPQTNPQNSVNDSLNDMDSIDDDLPFSWLLLPFAYPLFELVNGGLI